MGKKGELMRAAKADSVKYTFTKAQLAEHDKAVVDAYKAAHAAALDADYEATRERVKQWARDTNQVDQIVLNTLTLLTSVPTKVLVQNFGWNPATGVDDSRNRLTKFCRCVEKELNDLYSVVDPNIKAYAAKAEEITGIGLVCE